jgi:hypothetical protein
MTHQDDPSQSIIARIVSLAEEAGPEGMTIRDVLDRLDERAFGVAILIMAIPCLIPGLYGPPQILGVPIILLAGQMALGRREPWLPEALLKRQLSKAWLDGMAGFAVKRMGWFERLSRPRLSFFAQGAGERLAAVFMILATLTIVLPMTNTIPSIALALLATGVLQRDGLFVAAGAAIAAGWAGLLLTVALGFAFGAAWAAALIARFTG